MKRSSSRGEYSDDEYDFHWDFHCGFPSAVEYTPATILFGLRVLFAPSPFAFRQAPFSPCHKTQKPQIQDHR